jgi:DNA polymerase-3 subunit gamma/tau
MFYLKYRPQTVDEIDNSHVRDTIRQLLKTDTIPHALLFVGHKGTGKTSVARIVAKHLNQLESVTDSSDIVEMDAASNRGIDEVKSLIKEASFLPMSGKYRVFIIDEAHMITNEAFNALLKTLEEPPESAVFILATTNVEKVPRTIVSRTQVINFGRAKGEDIFHMLKRIKDREKITVGDDVLNLIIEHADFSFRDAAKILEELTIQKKLAFAEAEQFLGVAGRANFLKILEKNDVKETLTWIEKFIAEGGNVKNLLETLLEQLRVLLLTKSGVAALGAMESKLTIKDVSTLIRLFSDAYNLLKISPIESLPLEIAVVDFYNSKQVR